MLCTNASYHNYPGITHQGAEDRVDRPRALKRYSLDLHVGKHLFCVASTPLCLHVVTAW